MRSMWVTKYKLKQVFPLSRFSLREHQGHRVQLKQVCPMFRFSRRVHQGHRVPGLDKQQRGLAADPGILYTVQYTEYSVRTSVNLFFILGITKKCE